MLLKPSNPIDRDIKALILNVFEQCIFEVVLYEYANKIFKIKMKELMITLFQYYIKKLNITYCVWQCLYNKIREKRQFKILISVNFL